MTQTTAVREEIETSPVSLEVPGFALLKILHLGTISTVYEARNLKEDRVVALKVLHEHLSSQEPLQRRLAREVATLRRLDHPSIIKVYGLHEGESFLALELELARGLSLREYIHKKGPFSWEQARPILKALLEAIDQAHDRGIWHRDLHSDHLILTDEGLKIIGFGVSRVNELAALTMHTRILGSLESMAPERVLGMEYDGRADLYSIGAIAYEMILGFPLNDGSMGESFAFATRGGDLGLDTNLPAGARHFLNRALVTDPSARFSTAKQMLRALDQNDDEEFWRPWIARKQRACPACSSILVHGIFECLHCGHEVRRLIQNPGAGAYSIIILTPKDTVVKDVWFETNSASGEITRDQIEEITALLRSYEDTLPFATGAIEFRFPPYLLFGDLNESDKDRVVEELQSREIPHKVIFDIDESGPFNFHKAKPYNFVFLWIPLLVILAFGGRLAFNDEALAELYPTFAIALILFTFIGHYILVKASEKLLSRHFRNSRAGLPVIIPTSELLATDGTTSALPVVNEARSLIKKVRSSARLRDIKDAVSLVVSPFLNERITAEEVKQLYRAFSVLEALKERTTAREAEGLFQKLEALNTKISALKDQDLYSGEDLFEERRLLLDEMEAQEEEVTMSTLLSARLVQVRAALLEENFSQAQPSKREQNLLREELQTLDLLFASHPVLAEVIDD